MQQIDSGKLFLGKPGTNSAKTCFPFAVSLSNGDILASFQAASVKNGIDSKVFLMRSKDGAKTWSEPIAPFNPILNGKKGVLHYAYISELSPNHLIAALLWCDHHEDPSLEFFNPQTGGLLPTEVCISFSEDNGYSWSPLRRIEKGLLEGIPTPVMGAIQHLGNGVLICPFETSKTYHDSGRWHHKAAYFMSKDNGRTWPELTIVAYDAEGKIFYWDHRLVYLGEGNLVDLFWAYDAQNNKELNAYISTSKDFGKSWSKPAPTELVGQPWPIAINKNTFAVAIVDRNFSKTIKLYLTKNAGESFDAGEPLILYSHQTFNPVKQSLNEHLVEMSKWSYGLPSGCKINDEQILVVYYSGNQESTDVNWCKVKI